MTENHQFFAVSYGNQRGVFDNYKAAQTAMKGYPQPVYKKFNTKEEADEFLKKSQPESTSFEATENDTDDKFYAVARGRVIGIFKDMETVKKNTQGFPKAMHKRFNTYAEAKSYFEKYAEGKVEEKKTPKKRAHPEEEDGQGVKSVARKRTSGKVGETDESDGGEHEHADMTQSSVDNDETNGSFNQSDKAGDGEIKQQGDDEVNDPKPMDTTENVEEKKQSEVEQKIRNDNEDTGNGKKTGEPDNKQLKMDDE